MIEKVKTDAREDQKLMITLFSRPDWVDTILMSATACTGSNEGIIPYMYCKSHL